MRNEQYTPFDNPAQAPRPVSEFSPWRYIVGVSPSHATSSVCAIEARSEFYPGLAPVLVCACTYLQRHRGMAPDIAREVGLIRQWDDVVVDQTIVGKSGAEFFKNLAKSFVRVEITASAEKKGSAYFSPIARPVLVNDLVSAIQGGVPGEPVEVSFPKDLPDAAALRAEIKAAPESDQHSDLFLSMAIAIWRARKIRKQIERGGLPPPKVLW